MFLSTDCFTAVSIDRLVTDGAVMPA